MSVVPYTKPPSLLKQAKFRKKFLLVSIAGLALLGPTLGVSFLSDSGTAAANVTGSVSASLVYTSSLPCDILGTASSSNAPLKYLTTASNASCTSSVTSVSTNFTHPSWSPAANSAGSVTTGGDLALVDMSAEPGATTAIVNVYITNLQGLASDYSSFALPINVYYSCPAGSTSSSPSLCTSTPTTSWTEVPNAASFVTNTNGSYSISLPGGAYYDITIDAGGEYYCVSTTSTVPGATLTPQFFVTAQLA